MDYYKRLSRMLLIAITLALLLSIGILMTQQMIRSSLSHDNTSDHSISALSLFYNSDNGKLGNGEKLFSWKGDDKTEIGNGKPVKGEKIPEINSKNKMNSRNFEKEMNWIILGMITLILAIIAFVFLKKRENRRLQEISLGVSLQSTKDTKPNKYKEPINEKIHIPTEEIRVLLIKWEKQLPKIQQRHTYETIQQWFERIDKKQDFVPLYEKVRYGNKTLSMEEIEHIRKLLK
ncbi:LPXTG cell wall anchor domain-containing protein [Bacillus sp. AFS017336]|uniref:LPXTG cell wall anchor domain-containing protein n=1 Tax=Bacillus sp. AFS017336 TaxID=2033489 RepID=UPI000BF08655|nr:LPXTG cell wall anchor domain-containing protein [Bacillus sp. AFS017336]PEK98899.1 hypothetical protein CN601_24725 [Bacillus sp. AFS017336]